MFHSDSKKERPDRPPVAGPAGLELCLMNILPHHLADLQASGLSGVRMKKGGAKMGNTVKRGY